MEPTYLPMNAVKTSKTTVSVGRFSAYPSEVAKAQIHAVYATRKNTPTHPQVGKAKTMRERILALSLFPSIYDA